VTRGISTFSLFNTAFFLYKEEKTSWKKNSKSTFLKNTVNLQIVAVVYNYSNYYNLIWQLILTIFTLRHIVLVLFRTKIMPSGYTKSIYVKEQLNFKSKTSTLYVEVLLVMFACQTTWNRSNYWLPIVYQCAFWENQIINN